MATVTGYALSSTKPGRLQAAKIGISQHSQFVPNGGGQFRKVADSARPDLTPGEYQRCRCVSEIFRHALPYLRHSGEIFFSGGLAANY